MRLLPRTPRGAWASVCIAWVVGTVWLWSALSFAPYACIQKQDHAIGFTPDGKSFLTATADGCIATHNIPDGRERSRANVGRPISSTPTLSQDGRFLAWESASDDSVSVLIWDLDARRFIATLEASSGRPAFSPDGRYVATASLARLGFVRVWDLSQSPPAVRDLPLAAESVGVDGTKAISFSRDGRYLCGIDTGGCQTTDVIMGGIVAWWATADWREVGRIDIAPAPLFVFAVDAAFTADGLFAIHFGNPHRLLIIEPRDGIEVHIDGGKGNHVATIFPSGGAVFGDTLQDGPRLSREQIRSSRRGIIAVNWFEWDSLQVLRYKLGQRVTWARSAGWKDVQGEWFIRLIDLDTGSEIGRVPGVRNARCHWSPDLGTLVVATKDGSIAIWDIPPRKPVAWIVGVSALLGLALGGLARWRVRRLNLQPKPSS